MYVGFGPGFYVRSKYGAPPLGLVNLFAEAAPNQKDRGYTLLPTPGLVIYDEFTAPMRGIFYQQGAFNNDVFVVHGSTLTRVALNGTKTDVATNVPGSEAVSLAFSIINELILVADGKVYSYDGSTFQQETVDAAINFVSVDFIDGRFVVVGDNSSQFYWSNVLSTTFDPLNFATAEFSADDLVTVIAQRNAIVLFGTSVAEVWVSTGDANAPFQRQPGVIIEKGCIGPRAAVLVNQAICWVGSDDVVYRMDGYQATPISTPAISEKLGAADARVSFYIEDGHQFFLVSLPETAYAFDTSTNEWAERRSSGVNGYRPFQYVYRDGKHLAACRYTANVYEQRTDTYTDTGSHILREASLFVPLQQRMSCDNVILDGARGTGLISGQGEQPIILLDWSDDGGNTYAAPRNIFPGKIGKLATRMFTTRCGLMRPPGRVFRVRFTDPTLFRLDGMRLNEVAY
jgi:hypothetical protein